jgi:hypothetical protein
MPLGAAELPAALALGLRLVGAALPPEHAMLTLSAASAEIVDNSRSGAQGIRLLCGRVHRIGLTQSAHGRAKRSQAAAMGGRAAEASQPSVRR